MSKKYISNKKYKVIATGFTVDGIRRKLKGFVAVFANGYDLKELVLTDKVEIIYCTRNPELTKIDLPPHIKEICCDGGGLFDYDTKGVQAEIFYE